LTLRNPELLALLLLLPGFVLLWRWGGRRLVPGALLLRLASVSMLVLALTNPTLGREAPPTGPLVILVDQSDSLTNEGKATLQAEAERLARAAVENNPEMARRTTLLQFGGNVVPLEETTTDDPVQSETLDPAASDLARALRTARELLVPTGGRIMLLSDGVQTGGDALLEAERAAAAGLAVDVRPIAPVQTPDIRITGLNVPRSLYVNEDTAIQVGVAYAPATPAESNAIDATLRAWDGEQLLDEQQVTLIPGVNPFDFTITATAPGVLQLRTEVTGEGISEIFARNNSAAATILVVPPPRVLIVEGTPNSGFALSTALQQSSIGSQAIPPQMLPTRLSALEQYDGMVLIDVPVSMLTLEQMTSVREFVRSEGRGLVVTGGRSSYGLGAYKDTPLEQALPVMMDPPPRPTRTDIALLLVVDRSASMTAAQGISKFDMAKEAAILSTEALNDEDRIGILTFDTEQEWVVPFQQVGQGLGLRAIQDTIAQIASGGGTDIFAALNVGLGDLARQPVNVRHAVLLTDGRSFTSDRVAYRQLIDAARAQNITLSTIAIGIDSDTMLLDQLAEWGQGRYYFATTPEDIPRLTLLESEIARSDPTIEGLFNANVANTHPLLRGFSPVDLPSLEGYVATTPKDSAEVVLQSPENDPVLTAWQYGLGRAVAWTPSLAEPWATGWPTWGEFGEFWAQVVRYTLPEADTSGPLQVRLIPQPEGVRLSVDAVQSGGAPLDLADVTAQVTLPDGTQRPFTLPQTAPGNYARDLRLPDAGPYAVTVLLERDGTRYVAERGYVQPVPAEYYPPQAGSSQVQGVPLLQTIAEITGGQVLSDTDPNMPFIPEPRVPASQSRPLWPWLVGAALLLWVLEIAVRRGIFIR
jgi:Ca-activated chloride channel homolog